MLFIKVYVKKMSFSEMFINITSLSTFAKITKNEKKRVQTKELNAQSISCFIVTVLHTLPHKDIGNHGSL